MDQIAAWLERNHVSVAAVLTTVAILVVAAAVIFLLNRLLTKWLGRAESRLGLHYGTALTVARVLTSGLWIIALLFVLDVLGVGVGGLWTVLASAAAVIGVGFLATWAMVSNITAAFLIAIWRPFRLGDDVELLPESLRGRVIDRNLMFTVLREDSGATLQVPNNLFFQKVIRVSR